MRLILLLVALGGCVGTQREVVIDELPFTPDKEDNAVPISQKGIRQLASRAIEDCKLKMYLDSGGKPTIGVGHLLTKSERASGKILIGGVPVRYSNGITQEQAMQLLDQDLDRVERAIDENVKVPLLQQEYDALCMFVFNVGVEAFLYSGKDGGPCGVLRAINEGRRHDVVIEFRRWIFDNGKVSQGLKNRREKELRIWQGLDV